MTFQNLDQQKVIVLEMPDSLLYALKVLSCSRSLEGGPEGGITGTIIRILREFRDSKSHDLGFTTGHTIVEQLDKLYFMYYPYPPKDLKNHLKKFKRFHLVTSADTHELVQQSALENLMSVKEFIVQILINHLGRILEEDPFLFVKFQEAFNTNPHAFRRPKEIKTEPYPHNDKIQRWIRGSLRSHRHEGYKVLVTEDELLAKAIATTNCVYCGTRLRYFPKTKGLLYVGFSIITQL